MQVVKKEVEGFSGRTIITVKLLGKQTWIVEIDDFRSAPKTMQFADYLVDVSMRKKEYTLPVQEGTQRLNTLIDKFGENTDRWTGKRFKLHVEKLTGGKFKGKDMIILT